MNILLCVFTFSFGVAVSEEIRAGCSWTGTYDPEDVTADWGSQPVESNQPWVPTSTFQSEQRFTMIDNRELKLQSGSVTRVWDYDGDGTQDLLVATDGKVFFYRQNSGRLEYPVHITADFAPIDTGVSGSGRTGFAFTDINGDGNPDIILSADRNLRYYPAQDSGSDKFGSFIPLGTIDNTMFDVGDWNHDGLKDVITGHAYGLFSYYTNIGSSTVPQLGPKKKASNLGGMAYNRYPRILDLNQDGNMDLVYSINWGYFGICLQGEKAYFHQTLMKLEGGGDINVREQYKEHQAPELADFDGDGIMDLVTSGQDGDIIIFFGVDIITSRCNQIRSLIESPDLGQAIQNDDNFHKTLYDLNRDLQTYVNNRYLNEETDRQRVYNFYEHLVRDFPEYFVRQEWQEASLASFAGYIWVIMLECRPDTPVNRAELASLIDPTNYDHGLLRDYGIVLINNNGASLHKTKLIYDFFTLKNPVYFSLSHITQNDYLTGKRSMYGSMRESGINIFSGAEWPENSFPSDCQICQDMVRSPSIMTFIVALAHEVAHNELDQPKADAYRLELFERKYQILSRSTDGSIVWKNPITHGYDWGQTQELFKIEGWWDGVEDWNRAMDRFFDSGSGIQQGMNSIRGNLGYFVRAPQEAFATLANQYFSDSKLMLDFAVERTQKGYPANMDWFLLIAEYYSLGSNTIPMFVISPSGEMRKYSATLRRNAAGYITGLIVPSGSQPPPYDYNLSVDGDGFVTAVTTS